MNVLKTNSITMQFGGVIAVNELAIDVNEHEIVALIGPNGAGKTTVINLLTGVLRPDGGRILLEGADSPLLQ